MLSLAPSYNRALGENISITIYSPVVSFTRGRGELPRHVSPLREHPWGSDTSPSITLCYRPTP